jgi:copper chaperone NosL
MRTITAVFLVAAAVGCGKGVTPATLDPKNDQCGVCRMVVSQQTTAAQVVAPYQEPKFFDDMGCLNQFLESSPLPTGARVFVADHRTGEWVPAESAVYTNAGTPMGAMGSSLIAHGSAASRSADSAATGTPVAVTVALPALAKTGGPK